MFINNKVDEIGKILNYSSTHARERESLLRIQAVRSSEDIMENKYGVDDCRECQISMH